jgi:hypothetical protein
MIDVQNETVYARSKFGENFKKAESTYWADLTTASYSCGVLIGGSGEVAASTAVPVNTQPPLQIDEASQTKLVLELLDPMDQVTTMTGIGGEIVEGPIDNEAKISFAIGYYSPNYYLEIEPEISVSPTESNPGYTVNINNFGYERYLNGSVTPFGTGGHSKYKVTGSTGTLFVSRNTIDRRPLYLTIRVIDPTTNLIKATQKIVVTAKK